MLGGYKWITAVVLIVLLASFVTAEFASVATDEVSDAVVDYRDFSYRDVRPEESKALSIRSLGIESLGAESYNPETPWWDNSWHSRRLINITAFEDVSTLSVYELMLNTEDLITNGLMMPNCLDLRIVWYDRALEKNVDLDFDIWNCNNASTLIFFRNQKVESVGDVNDYYLYYLGENASPRLMNKSDIYFYYEDYFTNESWQYFDYESSGDNYTYSLGYELMLGESVWPYFDVGDYALLYRNVSISEGNDLFLMFKERDNLGFCTGGFDHVKKRFYFDGTLYLDQFWCPGSGDDDNWHLRQYFIPSVTPGIKVMTQSIYTNAWHHCIGPGICSYFVDDLSLREYSPHIAFIGEEESIGCSYDLEPVKVEFDDSIGVFVNAYIKNNGPCGVKDVEVEFLDTFNGELVNEERVTIGPIYPGSTEFTSVNFPLERNHEIYVIVDPDNKIKESNKNNNAIHEEYVESIKYYVEVDVPPFMASIEIENFVKENLKGTITPIREEADVSVLIARHNPLIVWHFETIEERGWGFYGGTIQFQDEKCFKPYCGVVGSYEKDGKEEVYIEANDVDGFVAATRAYTENQDTMTAGNVIFLGEDNIDAISVYDYLHNPDNVFYYKQNNQEFAQIVGKALKRERYDIIDSDVLVNNTKLRLRNLQPKNTVLFRQLADADNLPVVMAGGLWSDITAWDELGKELADDGFDVYLLEITGGPEMECDNCTDYTYEFLTDEVYPAYVDEVKSLSGESRIKFVGHSNGARVALDSLTSGQVNPDDVETLVLVAVPGNFSELSYLTRIINESGDEAIERMRSDDRSHITSSRVAHELNHIIGEFVALRLLAQSENNMISLNLFEKYNGWIQSALDPQPGRMLNLEKLDLIYGTGGLVSKGGDDGLVPVSDELAIYSNIQSSDKDLISVKTFHSGMPSDDQVKANIVNELKK